MKTAITYLFVTVLLATQAARAAFATEIFSDNFNRPDGAVGNGWSTWRGSIVNSPDIVIENGQLKTLGYPNDAGGVFRTLPVTFPIEFSFQFRTADPPNGGWRIEINADGVGYSGYDFQVRFTHVWGVRHVDRQYLNNSGNYVYEPLSNLNARNYQSDILATVSGVVQADLSSTITTTYNDGLSPNTITYSFPSVSDAAATAPGELLVLQNASAFTGPHFFDNLSIESPKTVQDLIEDLVLDVDELNLANGISNAVDQKLGNALEARSAENAEQRQDAVNKLYSVINATEAQRGNKISEADADFIVDAVLVIIEAIEGGSP